MTTTETFKADSQGIARAAEILRTGGLVAFPTETVYGLGADARNDRAVAGIFEAKGRPSFNPLIVHVSGLAMAEDYGLVPPEARALIAADWPEALTIVVPLRDRSGLSLLVTAGNPSVALRCPSSPIAQALIRGLGGPIAAPSANPSGRVSPTTAEHVLSGLAGRIDAVIDGGPSASGLESTIISFLDDSPVLLREGAFQTDVPRAPKTSKEPVAPGQLASHYAPMASVRLDANEAREGEFLLGFGPIEGDLSLSPTGDLAEAAANLYAALHEADARGINRLAVAPIPDTGLGRAINDRLERAAAPRD